MRVDQLLHGYQDGHRLLASSRELSRSAHYVVLTMSDLAGRSIIRGFDEYLTGYPLPESDCYAFAKTWYAPEMERPGCVWTHTFLLGNEDLSIISGLEGLTAGFRRPARDQSFDDYSQCVEISASGLPNNLPNYYRGPNAEWLAAAVLAGLYETPDMPVVVVAGDSLSFRDLTLSIWRQQWGALRAAFSFSTGSMSNRSIGGRPFDLQIVPSSSAREVRREVPSAVFIDPDAIGPTVLALIGMPVQEPGPRSSEAMELAATDLTQPVFALRERFTQFGHLLQGRRGFLPLTELALCGPTEDVDSLQDLLGTVARRFPSSSEAQSLKAAIAGPMMQLFKHIRPASEDEADLLLALARIREAEAFDQSSLALDRRIRDLWVNQRSRAEWLVDQLIGADHNRFGEAMLSTVMSTVAPQEVAVLFSRSPAVLASAVRRDPVIATSPSLWSGPSDRQRDLFDAATAGRELDEALRLRIVSGMLEAGSDAAAEQASRRFGVLVIAGVLNWAKDKPGAVPPGWRRVLSHQPSAVLTWLTTCDELPAQLALLACQVLDPHSSGVHANGVRIWQNVLARDSVLASAERVQLRAFALALAFDLKGTSSCSLAVDTFHSVHQAAENSGLAYDTWLLFEDYVPRLSVFRNWDKCERLRRGLVDRFDRNKWPSVELLRCAKDLKTLRYLLKTCGDYSPQGKRLLKRLKAEPRSAFQSFPADWREAVRRYL